MDTNNISTYQAQSILRAVLKREEASAGLPTFGYGSFTESIEECQKRAASELRNASYIERFRDACAANDRQWPAGASLSGVAYELPYGTLSVHIAEDVQRSWRGKDGTGAIVAAIRRYFHLGTLERQTREYDGTTEFTGTTPAFGTFGKLTVTISVGKALPPKCELVAEEMTETVTRTRFRTVCK